MDIVPTYVAPTAGAGCCCICRSGHKAPPRPRQSLSARKLDQGRKLSEGAASVAETCSARTTAVEQKECATARAGGDIFQCFQEDAQS